MNRLIRMGICFLISFISLCAHADPAPFGLILNKTTVTELKSKYTVTPMGINKNNGLEAYDIAPESLHFDGLISAKAAFSQDGILKWIQMSLPASKFEAILDGLVKKYSLVYKNLPFEGNKEAKLEEGNTYILLFAQKNSEEMDFLYINKKILDETLSAPTPETAPTAENSVNKPIEISQL